MSNHIDSGLTPAQAETLQRTVRRYARQSEASPARLGDAFGNGQIRVLAFSGELLGTRRSGSGDGDFSVRLASDYTGIDGKTADLFNQILAVSSAPVNEITRVRRVVGKEGKLKQRMSVPGAVGGWSMKVVSSNTLIDDLVRGRPPR